MECKQGGHLVMALPSARRHKIALGVLTSLQSIDAIQWCMACTYLETEEYSTKSRSGWPALATCRLMAPCMTWHTRGRNGGRDQSRERDQQRNTHR